MPSETTVRDKIAANVRAEIARASMSQGELAERLGMVQPVLSLRLQARRSFRAEELVEIASVLGVPVARLLPERVAA